MAAAASSHREILIQAFFIIIISPPASLTLYIMMDFLHRDSIVFFFSFGSAPLFEMFGLRKILLSQKTTSSSIYSVNLCFPPLKLLLALSYEVDNCTFSENACVALGG